MYSEIHQPNISYICECIATTLKHIFMVKHTQDSINITAIKVGAKDTTTFSKRCHDNYITSSFFVNILLVVYFCPCLLCFFKRSMHIPLEENLPYEISKQKQVFILHCQTALVRILILQLRPFSRFLMQTCKLMQVSDSAQQHVFPE